MITVMMRLEMQRVRGHHYHHEFFIYDSKVPLDPIGDAEGA